MGRTFGMEMRAFTNLGVFPSDGLAAWGYVCSSLLRDAHVNQRFDRCTINIMRDPRWGRNQVGSG
jgi:hypothetical protein